MKKMFHNQNGDITIMWNERPMINDYEYHWCDTEVQSRTTKIASSFMAGVELIRHVGPRICYGLLAARVKPHNEDGRVKISIAFTQHNSVKYEESGLLSDDFVYKGLPEEYVEQVRESMIAAILARENYPQCEIELDCAANCEVGSSPIFFGKTAEILTDLIYCGSTEEISNMDMKAFVEKHVKGKSEWKRKY